MVMIDLSHRRLAQINVGHLLAMADLDFGVHDTSRCFELGPPGQAGLPPALQEIGDEDPSRVDIELG